MLRASRASSNAPGSAVVKVGPPKDVVDREKTSELKEAVERPSGSGSYPELIRLGAAAAEGGNGDDPTRGSGDAHWDGRSLTWDELTAPSIVASGFDRRTDLTLIKPAS